jgi:hypothetical protein
MDWDATLKIAGGLVTLGGVTVALAKFFSNQNKALTALRDEITNLRTQTKILKQPIDPATAISTEAREALGADLHSISVPIPAREPTHLRIILSSDAEPEKVVGREIPLTKGIAGWVFQRKQASFKNPAEVDPHHFNLVDKAAGTNTGGGAILTAPLIAGNTCEGVIQFMKIRAGRFEESDVQLATRLAPSITRLLVQLQDSDNADIPSVAYGDMRRTTILFADITAYSEIAAKLRLHDTVGLLNEYYSRLAQFALGRGGKLEEYLGDGLYVSFFQEAAGQGARLAVATGFDMQASIRKYYMAGKNISILFRTETRIELE